MIGAIDNREGLKGSYKPVTRFDLDVMGWPTITLDVTRADVEKSLTSIDYFTMSLEVPFSEPVWNRIREYAIGTIHAYGGYESPIGQVTLAEYARVYTRKVISRRPDDTISIEAVGLTRLLDEYPFTADATLTGNVKTVLQNIVNGVLTGITISGTTNAVVPDETEVKAGDSRLSAIEDICDATDLHLVPTPNGQLKIMAQPTLANATDAGEFFVGEHGLVINSSSDYDRDKFGNGCLVRARWTDSNGAHKFRDGWAYNVDPDDPSRWKGPAGRKVWFEDRSNKMSVAGLQQIARNVLYRRAGAGRGIAFESPLALWVEPGDKITLQLPWGQPHTQLVQMAAHNIVGSTTYITTREPFTTDISSIEPALEGLAFSANFASV